MADKTTELNFQNDIIQQMRNNTTEQAMLGEFSKAMK